MEDKVIEFYKKLKSELETTTEKWPAEYLYKFIVPADVEKEQAIENEFNGLGAVIKKNRSKTGKFTSVSINVVMKDADAVIEKYQALSTIEGIISL